MQKNLLLTFDYELFLGARSGTAQKCLLQPTQATLSIFEKHGIRHAIFFVDTTYLLELKKRSQETDKAASDWEAVSKQIKQIAAAGHYVFPHIHPHWLDANYDATRHEWILTKLDRYRFHNCSLAERTRVFDDSVKLLQQLVGESASEGYRAGGWCIQPFLDWKPHFQRHQTKYEFSVLAGCTSFTDAQYHDFAVVPQNPVYAFSDDVLVEDPTGPYTQFAISSVDLSKNQQLLDKVLLKLQWKMGIRSIGDGRGVIPKPVKPPMGSNPVGPANRERIAMELLTVAKLALYRNFLKSNPYMHFISHPKMLSSHNLKITDRFLGYAVRKYNLVTDFKQMLP